jgi:hypothetical protein
MSTVIRDEDHRAVVAEVERLAERALGRPPRGCKGVLFVLKSLVAKPWPKCQDCGAATRHVVAWRPDEALLADFDLAADEIAAVLYACCVDCAARCERDRRAAARLEAEILRELRDEEG